MKSDVPSTRAPESPNKWEYAVYYIAAFGPLLAIDLLCEEKRHGIVLLLTTMISAGNAVYYGVIRKGLRTSFRRGLAILFSAMTLIGFVLYQLVLHTDELSRWDLPVEWFGSSVLAITIVFLYKHWIPEFWD